MNCREVHDLFVAYLDHEISPSEQTLIESHLAGCASCEKDLAALRGTRSRLTGSLRAQAAQAAPSPRALERLQASLAEDAPAPRRSVATTGRSIITMRTRWKVAYGLAAAALLATVAGVAVPQARAGAGDVVQGVFVIIMGSSAEGGAGRTLPPDMAALPAGATVLALQPTYLPTGFGMQSGSGMISGSASASADQGAVPQTQNVYRNGEDILVITTKAAGGAPLPDGTATTVNGHPAVISSGLSGTVETAPPPPPGAISPGRAQGGVTHVDGAPATGAESGVSIAVEGVPVPMPGTADGGTVVGSRGGAVVQVDGPPIDLTPIPYSNATKLTWDDGGTRVEVLSTLSADEVRKVAEGFKLTM